MRPSDLRSFEKDGMETLETSVMDLVFEEDHGWVIVDYKTGSQDLEKYRLQLVAYREAWEAMGGPLGSDLISSGFEKCTSAPVHMGT